MRRFFHCSGWRRGRAWTLVAALLGGAGSASCTQIESRDLIREGNALYADALFSEAIDAYSKSIELEPDGVKVFYNRGCAAMAMVLKLRGADGVPPTEGTEGTVGTGPLEARSRYADMALKDFQTWLDRAGDDPADEEPRGDMEAGPPGRAGSKRTRADIVLDYRIAILNADERCDDLLQYWMDKHRESPREENWYNVIARQYEECGQPEQRLEWMKKRVSDFPESVKAWHALAIDAFDPLWPDPDTGLPYNEDLSAEDRIRTANRVIELLDKATDLDPQFLDAYTWRAMAYTQRLLARTVVEGAELPEERLEAILAREDSMMAWKNQKAKCDLEGTIDCPTDLSTLEEGQTCCPKPPLTEQERADDAAAKAAIEAEMAAADSAARRSQARKRSQRRRAR